MSTEPEMVWSQKDHIYCNTLNFIHFINPLEEIHGNSHLGSVYEGTLTWHLSPSKPFPAAPPLFPSHLSSLCCFLSLASSLLFSFSLQIFPFLSVVPISFFSFTVGGGVVGQRQSQVNIPLCTCRECLTIIEMRGNINDINCSFRSPMNECKAGLSSPLALVNAS